MDLKELEEALKSLNNVIEGYDDYGNRVDIHFQVIKNGNKRHLLMYNKELLCAFKKQDTCYDGTFKSRPKVGKIVQTLTIMGIMDNQVQNII